MPTLEALWRAVFPAARPTGAFDALQQPVGWVRVLKARVPAFDALEPGDLAILPASTLDALSGLAVEPESIVDAVSRAGGSGVLIVGAAGGSAAVTRRAAALRVAALVLAEGDASALERSAIAYIVNGDAELERRAATLEAELERVALAGAGVDGLAATIARFLSRPVAIEGSGGELLALHAPADAAADVPAAGEYLRRRRGAALRVALPPTERSPSGVRHRHGARASGALLLLGGGQVTELERLAAQRIRGLLALELARPPAAAEAVAERGGDGLPSDGPPWVVIVARQVDEASPTTVEQRERVRSELRLAEPVRRLSLRGDAASLELRMVAAPAADDPRGETIARGLARRLDRPVAVSRPFDDPAARPQMEAQARAALEALEALPEAERRHLGRHAGALVATADELPAYRLLAALPALPDGPRQARALLQPLLADAPRRRRESLSTLRAVVDHAGLAEAAAALGIHRNTLTYRLRRIEQRTGWRMADPLLRFSLAVAVRIVQSEQDTSPAPAPERPRGSRRGL